MRASERRGVSFGYYFVFMNNHAAYHGIGPGRPKGQISQLDTAAHIRFMMTHLELDFYIIGSVDGIIVFKSKHFVSDLTFISHFDGF